MITPDRILPQTQIYNFLRTVSIKFEPLALYLNTSLEQGGYLVNWSDKTSWKYYQNMVGSYHLSDTPMYVQSIDTHQRILFSPESLKINPRTRIAYLPGGPYYGRLCDSYPDQVDLIKSILFPVPSLSQAIEADDLTLLGYGSGYLEEWEEPKLISGVEEFLRIYKERWYFDFLKDEPYFYLTAWGSLWTYLAMQLLTARVENIGTSYVHSWDLWNSLKACNIDNYSDVLNRKQAMFLYQNIDYLKTNGGKQSNLAILAEGLLSPLGIGLYGRVVIQEAETGAANYQLTPQIFPVRIPSSTEAVPAEIEIKPISTIQAELYGLGLTESESAEKVASVERKLGDTKLNEFTTKFLEIRPIAQNKPYAEILNSFLLETLITSVIEGYYAKPVEIKDPLTNNVLYLTPKELLALYHYASQRAMGIEETSFPNQIQLFHAFDPEIKQASSVVFHKGVKTYLSVYGDSQAYLDGLSYTQQINTPDDFGENVTNLWLRYLSHLVADSETSLDACHSVYQYLSSLCHTRRQVTAELVSGYSDYPTWLGDTGIDIASTTLSQYALQADPLTQWANLADAIITTLIPINNTLRTYGNFTLSDSGYARLRELFVQLCSYRVVFLESDRKSSEYFTIGKWSNDHGPDTVDTHGDFIVGINGLVTDHLHLSEHRVLDPGVQTVKETTTREHRNPRVALTTRGHFQSSTIGDRRSEPIGVKDDLVVSSGVLTLPHRRLTITMSN